MAAKKPQSNRKPKSRARAVKPGASELRLLGKVAVVTGGSRGIGHAIARSLAAEGCSVVITGRDQSALGQSAVRITKSLPRIIASNKKSPQIVAEVCDVRDPESVGSLFAAVKQRFGKIDVLVNNAGITQPTVMVEET